MAHVTGESMPISQTILRYVRALLAQRRMGYRITLLLRDTTSPKYPEIQTAAPPLQQQSSATLQELLD